jgi:ribosomal protein L11 methyltransferase
MPDVVIHVLLGSRDEAELAADALWQAGAIAIEERDDAGGIRLVAGVRPGGDPTRLLDSVSVRWPAEAVAVDIDAALDAWRPHARPVPVGERLLVRPPWVPPDEDDDRIEIIIDPGRAFGGGTHSSTRLALAALERIVVGGETLLDAGCGSGVLAIAALVLGAQAATGVDLDPAALDASRTNAAANGVADRLALTGDPVAAVVDRSPRFDVVAANMLLPDLVSLAPALAAAVRRGGVLVLSGILAGQQADLLGAYVGGQTLVPGDELAEEGWVALTLWAP